MSEEQRIQNNLQTQSRLIQDYINLTRSQKKQIEFLENQISELKNIIADLQCMLIVNTKRKETE